MREFTDRCTASRVGAGLLAAFAGGVTLWSFPITNGEGALLLFACLVPAFAMLTVCRATPPWTLAEVLHTVDRRD